MMSAFKCKGLDLIDRVPDELWTEVRDIVQETGIKTIPMEKKCKKAKWLFGEGSQIAVKRREAKSKGEKERYKHLNAEFLRIARRDKKAFLSDQCKEIEEANRMGKTRDLFKKSRDTKGTFHAKMGLIKDRNGMDLTEAKVVDCTLIKLMCWEKEKSRRLCWGEKTSCMICKSKLIQITEKNFK